MRERKAFMTINGRIVFLRNRLGLSQRVFGECISRSVAYVSKVESGKLQPSDEVVSLISAVFGVSEYWLRTGEGEGLQELQSIGDRIRLMRKSRDYTQEELAEEIYCSRNTVGMIERGTVRPGDEIVEMICDRLWIDRNWLLTGTGSMERTELTPFYELLRNDPSIRRHIRRYIDHLDYSHGTAEEEEKQEALDKDGRTIAYVMNDPESARRFFAQYNIPYWEEQTKNGIRFRVKAPREIDQERVLDLNARIRKARIPNALCDHEYVFRDAEDNTIVTYSPYDIEDVKQPWIEKTEHNFYGFGTTTFVIKC